MDSFEITYTFFYDFQLIG